MKRILPALIALAWGTTALAGPVELRADISDADGRVTMGDIFEGAGAMANVPVATRTGPTVVLDAGMLQVQARRLGLEWANPQGLRRVIVRAGGSAGAAGAASPTAVAGSRNVEVLTYARSIATGEIVQPEDLVWSRAAAAPAGAPRDAAALIGLAARRPLREGATASASDVSAPQVIRSGDTVLVTYDSGGVTLTLQGRAMANAALGDGLMIRNLASNRTFEAVASGPGQAVTGPAALALRSARNPAQYAQR